MVKSWHHGLIVSCQSEGDDPFNTPDGVALFARAAEMGGACAIRSQGIEKTRRIMERVGLPVIALLKSAFADGRVCITREWQGILALRDLKPAMIAVDGTRRVHEGVSGPALIRRIKTELGISVMADIALESEAEKCAEAGADCISTTLLGYTPETCHRTIHSPDLELIHRISSSLAPLPVIAEGHIATPDQAAACIQAGAWAVVVGTAVTRPRVMVNRYCEAIRTLSSIPSHPAHSVNL
ncbi:MAG: putative N-acetylmannosamine-6-phosphate 2-epimerase [Candidatus Delongbacteria bacterium]|nr:putative N-acetylmannosamine-6-phosphate 2-epimerase [Candidatus Delongbacteria bacterium]